VVLIGVLNGTLEARDAKTAKLLWNFPVERSKQNKGWVLTADRRFNAPFLYHSSWREAPIEANDRQSRLGGIFHRRSSLTAWCNSRAPMDFSTRSNKRAA
jgi:hypothetical protein